MRGLPLALALSVPLWAAILVGAVKLSDAARRGELPVLHLREGAPFGEGSR